MLCRLKACRKCFGDLVLDVDEWRCWQCGTYYYPSPAKADVPLRSVATERPTVMIGGAVAQLRRRSKRAARDINSVIAAKNRSENRWWNRNHEVIRFLDEGRTVREIATLIGRGQRQIRVIRERLNDIRAGAPDLSLTG